LFATLLKTIVEIENFFRNLWQKETELMILATDFDYKPSTKIVIE